MKVSFSLVVALAMFVFSLSVHGKVVYVNSAAATGGNGTSWATAHVYLQDALAQTIAGDEVWVAAGTYYPDDGGAVTAGDRTATFSVKQGVKLYGGFAGVESTTAQRNLATSVTTLSGEIWAEKLYWSLHVVTLAGNATLDGLIITKGNANGEAAPYNLGGGIYIPAISSLVVTNCTFDGNSASSGDAKGGAIYFAVQGSSITATDCVFSNNSASSSSTSGKGGAVYIEGSGSLFIASDCTFLGNTATSWGGAISAPSSTTSVTATNCSFSANSAKDGAAIHSSSATVTNCTFSANSGYSGGAIYSSSVTATKCTFSSNISTDGDGAIYATSSLTATNCAFSSNTGGAIQSGSSVTATNCTFDGNSKTYGGAISCSSVTVTNCTFSGNTATYSGGAISSVSVTAANCTFTGNAATYSGGAIHSASSSTTALVIVTNCTFSSNSATNGGAITATSGYTTPTSSTLTASNCTFLGNSATTSGGAIYIFSTATLTTTNCTFSDNTSTSYGGAISSSTASITATNCTLVNNLARGGGKKGGGIHADGLVKLFNNVLWHTLAETQANLIYITSTGSVRNADVAFPSPLNQAKNLIKGGIAGITAEAGAVVSLGDTALTILSSDPLFSNATNPVGPDGIWKTPDDGLRLQASSPALNLGLPMFLPVDTYDLDKDGNLTELVPVDFVGFDRIQGAALDLGAYEAGEAFLPISIPTQPSSVTVLRETSSTFSIAATGYDLHYQWYLGNSGNVSQPIVGATGNPYISPGLVSTSSYWVRVSNGLGFVDSQTATATAVPLIITSQPANTIVTIGTTASLAVTASGKGLSYQWYQGATGDVGNPMSGATLPSFTTPALAVGTSYWVRVTNPYGSLGSDAATVSVTADLLGAAMNAGGSLIYTTGGNASWFGQSITTHDAYSAAQSGTITHSQSTDMQTTVGTAGTISFWWKVSSQSGGDFLRFYIDGVEQTGRVSGTTGNWAQMTFTVTTAGSHTFKWAYTKNSSTNSGSDCGWVDEVVWTPSLITTQPTGFNILSGTSAQLSVGASGTNLSYQWYAGDSGITANPIPDATSSSYTSPLLSGTSKFWVRVGDGIRYESSATATITVFQPDPSLANALNSGGAVSYFTWGNLPWAAQSVTTHDGASALQSGAIAHSQNSVTEAMITGAGTLTFWQKVSSELGFDFLRFYIDGVEQVSLSGEVDWQQASFTVTGAGIHKLKWVYVKDDSKASGSDRAWLDQVAWQPAGNTTTFQTWASDQNLTGDNALMTANPSRDGVNNLLKYALGLNPNVSTLAQTNGTIVGLPSMELSGASMKFTFIKDTAKSDLTYTVEACNNLGSWQPVTTGIVETPLTGTLVRVVASMTIGDRQFCRLNVTK